MGILVKYVLTMYCLSKKQCPIFLYSKCRWGQIMDFILRGGKKIDQHSLSAPHPPPPEETKMQKFEKQVTFLHLFLHFMPLFMLNLMVPLLHLPCLSLVSAKMILKTLIYIYVRGLHGYKWMFLPFQGRIYGCSRSRREPGSNIFPPPSPARIQDT